MRLGVGPVLGVLAGMAATAAALGQQAVVTFDGTAKGSLELTAHAPGQILVSSDDHWGVIRAAGDLARDFGRVTGTNLTLSNGEADAAAARYDYQPVNNRNNTFYSTTGNASFTGPAFGAPDAARTVIIAGTLGRSPVVDALAAAGKLGNLTEVRGQWEAFVTAVVDAPVAGCARALVIAGSDARGTIYGLYDVSEQMGVSPWYFWADVRVTRRQSVWALPGRKVQGSPAVRYRGFFLNDEQPALTDWVASHWADTPYGPGFGAGFYALVFEVLLRLRANYLWPAIWSTMFEVDDPANQPLADAFEVVLGSSHTEPLMRAQNEFGHFYEGPWAYNLNNKTIDAYFRYGVRRAKPYARNSLWTMGMRGTGDTAIEGLGVDHIVSMLNTLVTKQQEIISDGLDGVDIRTVPQMWCLYKEVQSYIFEGLQVPDDVTLLWSDDNWGNVRRFPLAANRDRAGGAGVYYHFDYVGGPRDYKWINTVQLTKTAEQMGMALARGADRIWIVNVGDLKPLELPISHFFDLAYDPRPWLNLDAAGSNNADVDGTDAWAVAWAEREFGRGFTAVDGDASDVARTVADLVARYSMFSSRRKFELVEPETYSVLHYDEADAVLAQWAQLVADAQQLYDDLDAAVRPAFFEMVLHPVLAGETLHRVQVGAARNALFAGQQRNAANAAIDAVLAASADDANLTRRWDALLDGKWRHMMAQTHLGYKGYWQQPMRNSLPPMTYVQTAFAALSGDVGVGVEGSNASIQGDDQYHANSGFTLTTPPLEPYGAPRRYFDVFSRGVRVCNWTATPSVPWLRLSQSAGTVGTVGGAVHPDERVYVSVADWAQASSETVQILVNNSCRGLDRYGFSLPVVEVPVVAGANRTLPDSFAQGFVEADGTVAIDGAHYTAVEPGSGAGAGVGYRTFAAYGRTGSGVGLWPPDTEKLAPADAPALVYRLYLFSTLHTLAGAPVNVTVYLSPSQNYLGDDTPLAYTISLQADDNAAGGNALDAQTTAAAAAAPVLVEPVGRSVGSGMPPGWDGAVADGVWGLTGNYTTTSFALAATPGAYTLRIRTLLPSVIVQKIVVDLGGLRPSYLGPPESFLVGRDTVGTYNVTSFADVPGTLGRTVVTTTSKDSKDSKTKDKKHKAATP